ncbi:hypothetical protein [Parasitella parasitica]|uniref:Uncharacterized protein n=1 Tax=Parasitella parasitica TaxID=35722 RepID=A0A0B7MUK9_9FUNG|nr:hypothetical protein [Parasitella parasitica]
MTINKRKQSQKNSNDREKPKEVKVLVKIQPRLESPTHSNAEAVQRIIFARYLSNKFADHKDWKKVIWTSSFRINDRKVWACMSFGGVGKIREQNFEYSTDDFDPPNYKTIAYVKVLETDIMKTLIAQNMRKKDCILQTDPNCTDSDGFAWIHSRRNAIGSCIFGWPENSMDLHPMTPIINLLKEQLGDNPTWGNIANVWNSIPVAQVKKSIERMPHRLNAVLQRQGQAIAKTYRTYCLTPEEYAMYLQHLNRFGGFTSIYSSFGAQ